MTDGKGFLAWEGPSPVDGTVMSLVVTGPSNNVKTGPMWQAWLLVRDVAPFEAIRTNADRAICGDCGHRAGEKRTCYVSMFKGPVPIWRALQTGMYPRLSVGEAARRLSGEHIRITAYGDPGFLPFTFWRDLLKLTAGWVGYTHQWASCDPRFRSMLMASVETPREAIVAQQAGWRTFRARPIGAPVLPSEFQCPASEEAGHRTTCLRCRLCRGTASPAKHVSIELHGQRAAKRKGYQRGKYDDVRAELETQGYSLVSAPDPQHMTAFLALKIYYRRHRQDMPLSLKRLRRGLYLFWRREAAS